MKKIFQSFAIFCAVILMSSCVGDRCDIIGKWKISDVTVESERMSDSVRELIKNEYLSTTYEFQAEGKAITNSSSGDKDRPLNYSLDLEGNTLSINFENESTPAVHDIVSCSDNEFVLNLRTQNANSGTTPPKIGFTLSRVE